MAAFEDLYASKIVYEPGCWKTCGGGFCCSNNHPDFDFSFMTQAGTDIIYLPREYAAAEARLKTFNNTQGRAPKAFKLDLADASIGVVYTRCSLLGLCDGVVDKPLLCHFYPFLPVYTYDGRLEQLELGSVFDVTFAVRKQPSPCTVSRKVQYFEHFAREETAATFDTYTRFYLRCAHLFATLMRKGIVANTELMRLEGKAFWRRWELLHLAGRLFDKERLRDGAEAEYREARRHDPEFTLADEAAIIAGIRAL